MRFMRASAATRALPPEVSRDHWSRLWAHARICGKLFLHAVIVVTPYAIVIYGYKSGFCIMRFMRAGAPSKRDHWSRLWTRESPSLRDRDRRSRHATGGKLGL